MMHYPQHLLKLIQALKRLPGVGSKSAERFAFQMLSWPAAHLQEMQEIIGSIPDKIKQCALCGCLQDEGHCSFCSNRIESKKMCVIASARDVFAIEATREYQGLYHVLGGLLSPLHGKGPEQLSIASLKRRLEDLQTQEIVLALDSTLEGDATALFLKRELESFPAHVSRLAFGMPIGSSLDYIDSGTLARALSGRAHF